MELQTVIFTLEALTKTYLVHVTTDSSYVMDGVPAVHGQLERNDWKTAAKKPVKNEDLWKQLDKLVDQHNVT